MLRISNVALGLGQRLLALLALMGIGLVTSCTCDRSQDGLSQEAGQGAQDSSQTAPVKAKTLSLFIWGNYIEPSVLEQFQARTGITIQESNYDSNEALLAKVQAGASGFDLAVPSDYMVTIMRGMGLLEELDQSKIPNRANLDERFLKKAFDPENRFSLPYSWTMGGIAVNRTIYQGTVTSWRDLFENPSVYNKFSLLDDVRETMAAALKLHGFSVNSTKPVELAEAKTTLVNAKKFIKAFNAAPADLIQGAEVSLAHMYSQEALQAKKASQGKVEFVLPAEGSVIAIDNLVLLKGAPHPEEAYAFINFIYETEVSASNIAKMFTGPVVKGVKEHLPLELQSEAMLFPSNEQLARCELLEDLGEATADYDRIWAEIKAASH